jgi:hypothetical protein
MDLIRDMVSARTWLAFIHHLVGVVIGLAVGIATVMLLAFSVLLLPLMLIGFPVFGLMLRLADAAVAWLARLV